MNKMSREEKYEYWSLVVEGKISIYSHTAGITYYQKFNNNVTSFVLNHVNK